MNQGYSCSNLPSGTSLPYALAYNSWGDANSRATSGATATLSYNKLDEMTEWQLPNTSQAWDAYDSSGERTLQRTIIGSTTTITVYAFGLEDYSYDGSGNLTGSTHSYSLDGWLIGELQTTGGGVSSTYFFLTDNLGSLLAVFNNVTSNAVLLSTQLYAPYGSSRYSAGPQLSTYTGKGYTGQYSDAVSGLDYYNARYYDPVSGVFLAADSQQGNDQGMNPYAYAGNNPTTSSDPSGHLNEAEAYAGGGNSGLEGGDTSSGGGVTVPDVFQNAFASEDLNPDAVVTAGNTTYQYDQGTGELTVTTTNSDGSSTTNGYLPTDATYTNQYSVYLGVVAANDIKLPHAVNSLALHHSTTTPTPLLQTGGSGAQPPGGGHPPTAPASEPCSFTPDTQVAPATGEQPTARCM